MGFIDQPDSHDQITLGGIKLPGEVHIEGEILRAFAKKSKRGSGDDGAAVYFSGLKPADFTISLSLHTSDQEAAWIAYQPQIFDLNNPSKRNEFPIEHPQLNRLGISKCVVHGIGESPPIGGGPIKVRIMCTSVKLRTGATHKPAASKAGFRPVIVSTSGEFVDAAGPGASNQSYSAILKERTITAFQKRRLDNGISRPEALKYPTWQELADQNAKDQAAQRANGGQAL